VIATVTTDGKETLTVFETEILPSVGSVIDLGEHGQWVVERIGFRVLPQPGVGRGELVARVWVITPTEYLEQDL